VLEVKLFCSKELTHPQRSTLCVDYTRRDFPSPCYSDCASSAIMSTSPIAYAIGRMQLLFDKRCSASVDAREGLLEVRSILQGSFFS
jgi:hypothetical protein